MESSEDSQSKTEEPTQKKLDKAKEDGQILRSQDFSVAVILFGSAALIMMIGGLIAGTMRTLVQYNLTLDGAVVRDAGQMIGKIAGSMGIVLPVLAIVLVVAVLNAIIGAGLFGGVGFSMKAAAPKFSKLNPLTGLKRMFGTHALFELVKGLLKTSLIAAAIFLVISYYSSSLAMLSIIPYRDALNSAGGILLAGTVSITLALFIIAFIDIPYQLAQHTKKLRMSKQEIKDEMKESDGRPEVKARLRQRQREIAYNKMMTAIESADVIITNPSHFAVALSYNPGTSEAPRVVARGIDHMAEQIRNKAREHQVPLFEAPELARALYFSTRLNDFIPETLYHTVAEVIAYIFNVDYAVRQGRKIRRPAPVVPPAMRYNERGERIEDVN